MIRISIQKKLQMAGGSGVLKVDAEIAERSFTALYGPSGAGKTSLLRIIAGLLRPEQGIIEVNGQTWLNTSKKIDVPPQRRNIGFVFQDYALFPNMTVRENLLYALPVNGNKDRIHQLMQMGGLKNLAQQKPQLLSGGQKQRVALIRALVRQPQLLLLDEALSALDHETRVKLQNELRDIHNALGLTTLIVSHHIPEIYKLADGVIRLDQGIVQQTGSPAQIFGLHEQQNGLVLIGEVLKTNDTHITLLTDGNIVNLPQTSQTENLTVGDKVSIHAADLSLQKLS